MIAHKKYMMRCLDLAKGGIGFVAPNPLVGSVFVKNGFIVAEGFHARYGEKHAEIGVLESVSESDILDGILYCNLEPCSHKVSGKHNPPCVKEIIRRGVKHVVLGMVDPNPHVSGEGVRLMKKAGIKVEFSCEKECKRLNRFFEKNMVEGRPYIALKITQTLDGKIATKIGDSRWISSVALREKVHEWRSFYDAVLTTSSTVIHDNPSLTVRHVKGRNPVRLILDCHNRIPEKANVFSDKQAKTIVFQKEWRKRQSNVEQVLTKVLGNSFIDFRDVVKHSFSIGITSIMVECGSIFATYLVQKRYIDELICITAPKILGEGYSTFRDFGIDKMSEALKLEPVEINIVDNHTVFVGTFEKCLLD